MTFEDDPDVRGWRADPGRAPGLPRGMLALAVVIGVIGLGVYLVLPLDWIWSGLFGSSTPTTAPAASMVSGTRDQRDLQTLDGKYHPNAPAPAPVPVMAKAEATPETSVYDALKAQYDALNDRLNGLLAQKTPAPPPTQTPQKVTKVKTVDPEAQKRAEAKKQQRLARLQSGRVFMTRPKDEKAGQLNALKSPYSLAPSEEIPCETTLTVSSETPGAFVVWVSRDVPDTATRTKNVIPKGSKLVVKPRRSTIMGDSRIDVTASTLTFPSGPWLKLPAATMMDQYGTAGFTGKIDRHLLRNYGAVILTGVLRGGSMAVVGGYGGSTADRVTGTVAQDTASEATRDMRSFIRTDPTITVNPRKAGEEPSVYTCRYLLEDELVLTRSYPWTK